MARHSYAVVRRRRVPFTRVNQRTIRQGCICHHEGMPQPSKDLRELRGWGRDLQRDHNHSIAPHQNVATVGSASDLEPSAAV